MASRHRRRGRSLRPASFSVIAALFLVITTSLAVGIAHQLHQMSVPLVIATPKYLVVFVLDGAEPSYLHVTSLPHLDALRAQGVEYTRAFDGILESETPAGHATLATGSTPAHDGMLGFNWITQAGATVHTFDPSEVRAGVVEHVMQAAGASTIAGLFKARYPTAKVVALSGHKYYAADPLGGPNADYIMYYAPDAKNRYVPTAIPGHVPPAGIMDSPSVMASTATLPLTVEDDLATKLAIRTFQKVHQQVTLINMPEFDWPLGHVYGGEVTRTKTLMQAFDKDLGQIEAAYAAAGVLSQTDFVVTADHGMSPLQVQIPDSILDDAVTQSGTTSPETTYSTAGYIWLQDRTRAQMVADAVAAKKDPHVQSVYYKVTAHGADSYVHDGGQTISSAQDAANQYLLSSFLGGNAPDVVAFCTENAAFVKKGAETWKGNHGGGSWGSQHIPLVMSGPGIVSGSTSTAPARLEDVAPTVLSLFGIKSTGMQGSVLADALASPTPAQARAQSGINNTLTPVVQAMMQQSQQEIAAK